MNSKVVDNTRYFKIIDKNSGKIIKIVTDITRIYQECVDKYPGFPVSIIDTNKCPIAIYRMDNTPTQTELILYGDKNG